MKWLVVIIVVVATGACARAQCYDQFGRPRTCPNTPRQIGLINRNLQISNPYAGAGVAESWRWVTPEPQQPRLIELRYPSFLTAPEELWIRGEAWRRVR